VYADAFLSLFHGGINYWMALPTLENTVVALPPIAFTVPSAKARIIASITAYSATSWPLSSGQIFWRK